MTTKGNLRGRVHKHMCRRCQVMRGGPWYDHNQGEYIVARTTRWRTYIPLGRLFPRTLQLALTKFAAFLISISSLHHKILGKHSALTLAMTGKGISKGTLNLRFMQNAQRNQDLAAASSSKTSGSSSTETNTASSSTQDESKWEVSAAVKEAWGIGSGSGYVLHPLFCTHLL